jgi:archaellum component FlaD/FlaE
MGMASSDDDAKIIAEYQDLQDHLASVPHAERLEYERMNEDQKAMYEYEVRQRARYKNDRR